MKCLNCGAEIEKDGKFCQYCGTALSKEMAQENSTNIMEVNDFFGVFGRGLVVSGIAKKRIKVGDYVINKRTGMSYKISGIEMHRKMVNEAMPDEVVGLLLSTGDGKDFKKNDELIAE